jgi:hypothetical protein
MDSLLHATDYVAGNSADVGSPTAPTTNAIGVPTTPTLSAAFRPDGAFDFAPPINDHLSECTQVSHLSACTAETHVSVITEDSMLNHEPLPVTEEVASSGDGANMNPESISAHGSAQCVIVCPTSSNETHITTPETVVRSPNEPLVDTDNPDRNSY